MKHLGYINLKKNSSFSSTLLRVLCEINREVLESIHLKYSDNTLREETRIIVQEFGLNNFTKLGFLKLQMNRSSWFSEILDYIQSETCTLKSLDLGYNDLNPSLMLNLV